MANFDKDKLIKEICSELISDIAYDITPEWEQIELLTQIEYKHISTSGRAYYNKTNKNVYESFAPSDNKINNLLEKLRNKMAIADKNDPWCACLIYIKRKPNSWEFNPNSLKIKFEYKNPERWVFDDDYLDRRTATPLKPNKIKSPKKN